jgi:diguanylate cyclase (GGDEF)-like protein/PAS domain S-box-containing protein
MISAQSYTDIQTTLTLATEMATDFAKAFKGKAVPSLAHAKAQAKFQLHSQAVVPLVLLAETQAPLIQMQAKIPTPIMPKPAINIESPLLHSIIEHMVEPMFLVNKHGIIEAINPEGAKLFGAPKITLIGQKLSQYFCSDARNEYEGLFQGWRETLETQLNHGPKEVLLKRSDGTDLDVDLSLSCIPKSAHNDESVFIGVMHNLSSHKAEYKELRRLARTDCLTQLANRHAFDEVLQRSWNECAKHGMPLSLVIIDVDYFKQFNDAHGHVQGDECLKRIAQVIQAALPSRHCLAARYGGEEFALILPGCNAHIAGATARRIQQQINKLSFTVQGLDASVSVSVSQGIACERNGQFRTPIALLCAADTALYRAKSDGRDRINLSQ